MPSTKIMEQTLRVWCDNNLTGTKSWAGSASCGRPCTLKQGEKDTRVGTLVYMDGTSYSTGCCFHDAYLLNDGYGIYTGVSNRNGESIIQYVGCRSIIYVVNYLAKSGGYHKNLCQKLLCDSILNVPWDEADGNFSKYELELKNAKTLQLVNLTKCTDDDKYIINAIGKCNDMWLDEWWNESIKKQREASRKAQYEKQKKLDVDFMTSKILYEIAGTFDRQKRCLLSAEMENNELFDNGKIEFSKKYGIEEKFSSLLQFLAKEKGY